MKLLRVLAVPAALILVAACGGGGSPGAAQSTAPGSAPSATTSAHPVSQTTARPPAMVGVTAGGSLVLLSPVTGAPIRALVRGGVIGDEISVSADGQTIYFSRRHGCVDDVESVPLSGGKPTLITTGSLPAISPDGSTLAFARQPTLTRHCMAGAGRPLRAVRPGHPHAEQRGGAGLPGAAGRPVERAARAHLAPVLGSERHRAGRVHRRDPGQRGLADRAAGHRDRPELPGRNRGHAGADDRPGPPPQLLARGRVPARRQPVRQPRLLCRGASAQRVQADVGDHPGRGAQAPGGDRASPGSITPAWR